VIQSLTSLLIKNGQKQKSLPEILVVHRGDLQVIVSLHGLDPRLALALRIDEQREARRLRHDDRILHGQLVAGQALGRPGLHLLRVGQVLDHVDGGREGDALVGEQPLPVLGHGAPVVLVEGALV